MDSISEDACFEPVSNLEVSEVPDGFVIYDEPNGKVHYLNPTAAIIYSLCNGKKTVADIQSFIRSAYETDEKTELDGFFQELSDANLIVKRK
ncbi:PqqD family protein [Hoeflea prorocentri]|uniref:PqqD family protein n=1 Tax=Hoeflea prorocentri TaxID=1922333 RepID=A0A9X3UGD5_9HYPH|nr:PqqD family protein [Hoeflea prorocentri]MCY6380227.1 PqqD family protein [Hoeflea prorocentri]MDA5398027.1 PqqD family protein [Hoeflea prorocentri]